MRHLSGKTAKVAIFAFIIVPFLTCSVEAQENSTIQSTTVKVYKDGIAHITHNLTVDELQPEITIPLLSASVENSIVLDANNLAVDFELNNTSLNVFTLGATQITIEYDTAALTNKQAEVWSILLNNPYNITLFLPQNATIVYLNQMPTQINTAANEVSLVLNPNQWEISYIVPLQQDSDNQNTAFPIEYLMAAVIGVAIVVIVLMVFLMRKRKINVKKTINRNPHLSKDDKAVIEFLAEKEGKAFEAEIRKRFPDMPRTSLWRLIKRLEKLEIIEVERIGLENQVKLKNR